MNFAKSFQFICWFHLFHFVCSSTQRHHTRKLCIYRKSWPQNWVNVADVRSSSVCSTVCNISADNYPYMCVSVYVVRCTRVFADMTNLFGVHMWSYVSLLNIFSCQKKKKKNVHNKNNYRRFVQCISFHISIMACSSKTIIMPFNWTITPSYGYHDCIDTMMATVLTLLSFFFFPSFIYVLSRNSVVRVIHLPHSPPFISFLRKNKKKHTKHMV